MSRYGWSSARGRISPFRGPDDDSVPHVTDEDFAYITSQDLEDAVTSSSGLSRRDIPASDSQEAEDDVLLVKNKGITYPLHFPAYCIGDGKLVVTDLKARLGTIMELTDTQVQNMTLLYKGKKLQLSDSPVRDYGVKNRSEILSVIPESGPSVEFSDSGSRVRKKGVPPNSPEDRGMDAPTRLRPDNQTKPPPSESHEKGSEPNATYDSDNESSKPNDTYDSDNESITSVASSLFSNTSSSTASSVGPVEHRKEVSEQLVEMLLSNGMRSVYQLAIDKLGNEFFLKIHNRILSRYLKRLKESTTDPGILLTIQTLSSRSQRSRASQLIIGMLSRNALEISNSGREKRLNERLKIASRTNRPAEDRDETSEEEVDEDEGSLKYLDLVVAFFRESSHFEKLRSELQSVTNLPDLPQTISEAVAHNDPLFIAILLDTQFRQAASGEYIWIKELKEIGYSNTDIAQLLHEKAHDSPWIYFKPEHMPSSKSRPDHHLLDCAHSLKSESARKNQASFSSPQLDKDRQVRQAVEELCGLGGILPSSRDKAEWNGTVAFDEARSMATITYSDRDAHGHNIHYSRDLFRRLIHIAERFETAARMVQDAEFCCDSFTVLKFGASSNELTTPEVQLSRIEFSLAKSFLQEMKTAVKRGEERNHVYGDFIGENLHEILKKVTDVPPAVTAHNIEHLYSLAVQVLCVGFISYIQAHVGPIQPFFIDRPLERIVLKGCVDNIEINSGHIVAELVDLTCLGQMCKGPVLVFRKSLPGDDEASDSRDSNTKYDIRATPCDILDTWGPGELVFRSEKSSSASAIKLGGGFISPPSSDVMNSKYHWDWCLRLPQNPAPIALNGPITVGGLVNVNSECKNEEQACWSSSLGKFEELGTHRSFFEAHEYQFGFQGGPDNFSLTGNKVWSKRRGRTIKTRNLEQEDYMLVPFLSFYWGVRVSYCTGVAQRVSLRQLVADLLPAFSKTYTSMESKKSWQELLSQYHIIKTFQTSNSAQELSDWLSNLPDELYKFVLSLIRQILGTLADTGLSPDGTQFFVAWPYNGVVNRCFHIPLSSYNTWAPILADSDDCATFAYMTNTCLQSGAMTCRGPNPNWDNRLYMLETAVLCPASTGAWSLRHERTYFFHKLDNNLYWVKAQREGTQSGVPASLVRLVSARSIPLDIRQRLIFKEERKKEKRLREKDLASVPAEVVCVRSLDAFSVQSLSKSLS
ncbi:unnamed protein product [Clonostachys byssicola]|uniref:Ubiquitin-like domain-containing protein n=1 Tax=Clonostachys byssicola TaxID=160290 RepID=A0A9N9V076_9HYPO|nr:unnamed protein product [Clonostachys byssicola]